MTPRLYYGDDWKDNSGTTSAWHVIHKTVTASVSLQTSGNPKVIRHCCIWLKIIRRLPRWNILTVLLVIVYSGQDTEALCTMMNVYNNGDEEEEETGNRQTT